MKVDFLEQVFSDFKAFSGKHTFRWDLPGVTYVSGRNEAEPKLHANGTGKSSSSDALSWCLYGKTPGGLKNPDVMPWVKGGTPKVLERFTIGNKAHTIQRTANPNSLLLDDKEVAQDAIDDLLGMDFELFTNTVLLAQGRPLFFDRGPAEKMELLSETLQLSRWDSRSAAASQKFQFAETQAADRAWRKEASLRALEEVEDFLATARTQAEEWTTKARGEARAAKKQAEDLQREFDAKDKLLATALLREDGAATELQAQNVEVRKLTTAVAQARANLRTAEDGLVTAERLHSELARELVELDKAKTCPTCGQPVKKANLGKYRAHLDERIEKLEQLLEGGVPQKVRTVLSTLEQQLTQAERYAEGFQGRVDGARSELDRLRPELARIKVQLDSARKAASLETENPYTAQISILLEKKKTLTGQAKSLDNEIARLAAKAERYKVWVKGFKDIKLQLVDDTLQELELVTNGMLEEVGLTGWLVRYETERETKSGSTQRKLHVQINSPKSKGFVKWESWSGGEQQRLRLIGALALSDVLLARAGVETNLEILDEPAMYYASEGVQVLCATLAERARDTGKSIWFVEHQAVESSHFSNTLTVVRDDRGSYIEDADSRPDTRASSTARGRALPGKSQSSLPRVDKAVAPGRVRRP